MIFKYVIAFFMANLLMLPLSVSAMDHKELSEGTLEHSHLNVITSLIDTLRFLQSTQDYSTAFTALEQLDSTMDGFIAQGSNVIGEDYFRAHRFKSALEIILIQKTLDVEGCYSARVSFQADFMLIDEQGDPLPMVDYPSMVKEAYAMLNKLCEIY